MASFNFSPPVDLIKQLERMDDSDRIAKSMLKQAIPIVKNKLVKELAPHDATGDMSKSIKSTSPKQTKQGGYFVSARPTGESNTYINNKGELKIRSKPVRNMEKLVYLEYGTSKNQPARPIIAKVISSTEEQVLNKMQEVFNGEIGE